MKYALVTTFAAKHYDLYGKRMIETFSQYWPQDVEIHIYHEGDIPTTDKPRVFYKDLLDVNPDLVAFKERYKNDPVANGMPDNAGTPGGKRRPKGINPKWFPKQSYLWDAVRFSHKVYAQTHLASTTDADVMFWVDADTITYRNVGDAYKEWLPPNMFCSYLGRKTYTECGFIGFNLKHPSSNEFMERYKAMYNDDTIFDLIEWTDCHAFDKVREDMEKEGKITNYNLNTSGDKRHPFVNSPLGAYMDHLKGNRKQTGSSWKSDIHHGNTELDYWKRVGEKQI